jgi:hypothetical protein
MSYFLYIFCRSQSPIKRQEITEFIEEGVYFDEDPRYEPPAQFGENRVFPNKGTKSVMGIFVTAEYDMFS